MNKELHVKQRKSISGIHYPLGEAKDWIQCKPLGYFHISEEPSISMLAAVCMESDEWIRLGDAVGVGHSETRETLGVVKQCYVGSGKKYEYCQFGSMAVKASDMCDARTHEGKAIKISVWARANRFFTDHSDGMVYPKSGRLVVTDVAGVECISPYNVHNGHFVQCKNCSKVSTGDHIINDHECGGGWEDSPLCHKCIDKLSTSNVIHSHNHKSYPPPLYDKRLHMLRVREGSGLDAFEYVEEYPRRLFGVEAELEFKRPSKIARGKYAKMVQDALTTRFAIIKHDGSLSGTSESQGPGTGGEYGFEIVTGPCDLEKHRAYWPRLVMAERYKDLRAWDTETCGLHVHVSREVLTTLQVGRILMFVNHPDNKQFIQKIAGRNEAKYCKYFPKKPSDSLHPETGDYNEKRRVAVNVQNPGTIEFRIFRGTINPKHIIRNIEFCDALCDFAHPASRSFRDSHDPFKFIEFVANARASMVVGNKAVSVKKWPLLHDWFVYIEAIPAPKKPDPKYLLTQEAKEAEEEYGEKSKYTPPLEKAQYSIGIK